MKIEKGKLYYDTTTDSVFKADESGENTCGFASDKIAVHCPANEDWEYVSKWYKLTTKYYEDAYYSLDDNTYGEKSDYNNRKRITIDQFKEFYPHVVESVISDRTDDNDLNIGHKEQSNKLPYELDFNFITQLAERMQTNKSKYEPYNWKKPFDVEGLKQALFRHVIEVMKGNYKDEGREFGHLEAIACNVMMINYQIKNND